ncbi:MAG: N-acetylmuramic acid 6-phosphate etherase [Chloroflexota bacterium]|nr:N-acetylmuramic acid 6-phosphate etherase [Chloroflexota bacterium]
MNNFQPAPDPTLSPTERSNPLSTELDRLSTIEMLRLMNRLDAQVPLVIGEALPTIAQMADLMTTTLAAGGRLFYQGAGTSGRLAVLDAAELIPTFNLPPGLVIGLIAGGATAMTQSVEGVEDDTAQAQADLMVHHFCPDDMLIGIAASGRTPYVLGGLTYATAIGAATGAIVCNPNSPVAAAAGMAIELVTGPEVLTGSTRLRAGTAQKLVLNMLSMAVMAKLGKVYGNHMVDVQPTNAKLRQRAVRIVAEITGLAHEEVQTFLQQADGQTKTAVVMGLAGVDAEEARRRLASCGGRVRGAIVA